MESAGAGRGRWWAALALDAALAAACAAWAVVLTLEITPTFGPQSRWAAVVIAAVNGASVLLRRRAPLVVAAVIGATAVAYRLLGLPPWFLGPAALVAGYSVAVHRSRTAAVTYVGVGAAIVALSAVGAVSPGWDSVALYVGLLTGAALIGDQVRRRQEEASAHAERARQLEAAREELARYAVTEERLRIARELHDVVAHSMSVVALNAGAARVAAEQDPKAIASTLSTIETTSRAALAEMRQLLGILRNGDDASRQPLPGVADLPMLVAGVAAAGLAVDVAMTGEPVEVPAGVGLAVYRIVQEALTNTMQHSDSSTAHVAVDFTAGGVTVRVRDDGPARAEHDGRRGSGLVGMRERVGLYGGALRAEATPSGGFEVEAFLPVEAGTR